MILANPPFAGKVQSESILSDLNHGLNTRATELLFLKWFIDHLAPGAAPASSCPTGFCFGQLSRKAACVSCCLTACDLQAVMSLPVGYSSRIPASAPPL